MTSRPRDDPGGIRRIIRAADWDPPRLRLRVGDWLTGEHRWFTARPA